ncbi:MAG: ABC transporter permease, partial [Muribaculaceae bacterium]|nr:ABC transporter permease [Muribaculaceae bacterium]
MNIFGKMKQWFLEMARVFRRETARALSDVGVLIFFFLLPFAYPLVYSAIYNPEVTRDMPIAVVDDCRTAESRLFVRGADATEAAKVCGYASDMAEARRWMADHRCYAIMHIPADYSERLGRGEQGVISVYYDLGLLLRYRTFLSSFTELQMATDTRLRGELMNTAGLVSDAPSNVQTEAYFLGDPQQGFASFILIGIVVLILQQSMLLGIVLLDGTERERRLGRSSYGLAELPGVSPSALVAGRALSYTFLYLPAVVFILHYIPEIFNFPHLGNMFDGCLLVVPMLLATAMLGQAVRFMASERESAFVIVVFTSVVFLFLSGLTWPRFAMSPLWYAVGSLVPATCVVEGFMRI